VISTWNYEVDCRMTIKGDLRRLLGTWTYCPLIGSIDEVGCPRRSRYLTRFRLRYSSRYMDTTNKDSR